MTPPSPPLFPTIGLLPDDADEQLNLACSLPLVAVTELMHESYGQGRRDTYDAPYTYSTDTERRNERARNREQSDKAGATSAEHAAPVTWRRWSRASLQYPTRRDLQSLRAKAPHVSGQRQSSVGLVALGCGKVLNG